MKKSIVKRYISILLVLIIIFNCCISASAFQEGETRVQVNNWGVEVYISKTAIIYIGAGISIGGVWVPEPVVSKVLATAGVVVTMCPGGIVLEYHYGWMAFKLFNPVGIMTLPYPTKFRWQ